jgi:hypothetical protein
MTTDPRLSEAILAAKLRRSDSLTEGNVSIVRQLRPPKQAEAPTPSFQDRLNTAPKLDFADS